MIEVRGLSKRYGATVAVDDVTFDVRPGVVTGFLGPNGAGKSTTMRLILGLDHPTAGAATVHGRPYRELPAPMREVGALLDAQAVHGGRSAHRHLTWLAQAGCVPRRRVGEVLDLVGLADVAGRRIGGFSLGMAQRLGLAAALLGDPQVLVLDEPVNGLDPDGIELTGGSARRVRVVTPDVAGLAAALERAGGRVRAEGDGSLEVAGLEAAAIGDAAAAGGLRLHELTPLRESLESVFMELVGEGSPR